MSDRRQLRFASEDDVLAEIAQLRTGHSRRGKWTFAQIAWHIGYPIRHHLAPPADGVERTPDQERIKTTFVDYVLEHRKPPPGVKDAPDFMVPPSTASDSDIDQLETDLGRMKAYPHPRVMMGPLGPVTTGEFRELNLIHIAHHLSFLEPAAGKVSRRAGLRFANEDAAIAEVENLRRGCVKAGNWTLAQACWHLNASLKTRMQPGPFPANTPEQDARKDVLEQILASGRLPDGIQAPSAMEPAPDCDEAGIDAVISTLKAFKNFRGPIAPHRLFGNLSDADARKINLIHFAHHLSYLVQTNPDRR